MPNDAEVIVRNTVGQATTANYRSDIDGLRCVAVMLVVLFHFGLPEELRAGFVGVDVFFVISGYLIIPPIISDLEQGRFAFLRFYERRVRRLAPAMIATTILTLLAALIILTPLEIVNFAKEATAAQLYVSNIYYWRYLNYFGLLANQSFLLHTWSLGVEEQFYITIPLGLLLIAKALPGRLIPVIAIAGALSFGLNLLTVHWKPEATFYLLPTRIWEFAAGAMVPELVALAAKLRVPTYAFTVPGIAIMIVAIAIYEPTFAFPGWFATLPVVSTVLLLIGGTNRKSIYYRVMSSAVPRYIGRISYELYLVHWPIKIFLPLLVLEVNTDARIIGLAASFLAAAAIFHLVEAPIRARLVLKNVATLIATYAGVTTIIVLGLTVVLVTGGLPARFSQRTLTYAEAGKDFETRFRTCEGRANSPCRIGAAHAIPTWLIYGDSHADALAGAFSNFLAARGEAAYLTFLPACMPVENAGEDDCRKFNRDVAAFVQAHPRIRTIALVSTWQLIDGFIGDRNDFVKGPAAIASLNRSLEQTINRFSDRQLLIWLPVPGARTTVPATLARNSMWGRNWELRFPRVEYEHRIMFLRRQLARHSEIVAIDPGAHLCSGGMCEIAVGGRPLYYDNAHPAASQQATFQSIIEADLHSFEEGITHK